MAGTLTWQQTYSLAKSQGLSDVDAAKSANNWAVKGGKPSDGVDMSKTSATHDSNWSDDERSQISGTAKTTTTSTKSGSGYTGGGAGPVKGESAVSQAGADLAEQLTGKPYDAMTQKEADKYASDLANSKFDAAISALKGQGALLKTNYEGAVGEIDAMYGNRQQVAQGLMDEVAVQSKEGAIARGGGRGGLETYLAEKGNKQVMAQLAQTENEMMAKKNSLRGSFDASTTNNLTAIQQALSDKGSFQSATAFEAFTGDKDKGAQYAYQNNALMAPYMSETANQARTSDREEEALYERKPDNSMVTGLREYFNNLHGGVGWSGGMTTLTGAGGKQASLSDADLKGAGLTLADGKYSGSQGSLDALFKKYNLV